MKLLFPPLVLSSSIMTAPVLFLTGMTSGSDALTRDFAASETISNILERRRHGSLRNLKYNKQEPVWTIDKRYMASWSSCRIDRRQKLKYSIHLQLTTAGQNTTPHCRSALSLTAHNLHFPSFLLLMHKLWISCYS